MPKAIRYIFDHKTTHDLVYHRADCHMVRARPHLYRPATLRELRGRRACRKCGGKR